MTDSRRGWALPGYLLLCVFLGGSSRFLWPSSVLQLLGILLIAWATVTPQREPLGEASRYLLALAAMALVLILLQLVPLSPGIWAAFPGRQLIEEGYRTLEFDLPRLPLSLEPDRTLESAYSLIPPLALIVGMVAVRTHSERMMAGIIVFGALANVILGVLQVASDGPPAWPYLYHPTNHGAVGFFANRNHMATYLLASVPFAAALIVAGRSQVPKRATTFGIVAIGATSFFLILVGLLLNQSLAALLLAIPVFGFSALLFLNAWRFRGLLVPAAVLAFIIAVVVLANSSIRTEIAGSAELGPLYSRGHIWDLTVRAISASLPLGTGLGTFPGIYAVQENPAVVDPTYVNHAHNDYLELILETGVPGLLLMLVFFLWYGWRTIRVWRSSFSSLFAKAASIACAAILAHSLVDYPLRTTAIAALFGMCLAMVAQSPRQSRSEAARHIKIA